MSAEPGAPGPGSEEWPKDVFTARPEEGNCPGCGCPLELYEIFAARIRGLKRPVCYGCLAKVLVFVKEYLKPTLEKALEQLEEHAEAGERHA